jgi:hypothetical protein
MVMRLKLLIEFVTYNLSGYLVDAYIPILLFALSKQVLLLLSISPESIYDRITEQHIVYVYLIYDLEGKGCLKQEG